MGLAAVSALAAVGCGSSDSAATDGGAGGGEASLTISAQPQGLGGPVESWTLTCEPAGGTLPKAAAACVRLSGLDDPFAPIPSDAICTEIYGGPAEAQVVGSYRGKPVTAQFRRTNGCEISHWDAHGFLFPIALDLELAPASHTPPTQGGQPTLSRG